MKKKFNKLWSGDALLVPFHKYGLTLIPAWISNPMPSKVWDETTDPFLKFNGCTVEVWAWESNFLLHFIISVITYLCLD